MIKRILSCYAELLGEYLARTHHQPEGMAMVGLVGSSGEPSPNKMVISLVNLEKEGSGDMSYLNQGRYNPAKKGAPLMMNLYIILSAVYESKRYAESLSVLSDTLAFIQSRPKFSTGKENCTVEVVPMSTTDLHNIWTTMGGQYYPSVICKVRSVLVDTSTIVSGSGVAVKPDVKL